MCLYLNVLLHMYALYMLYWWFVFISLCCCYKSNCLGLKIYFRVKATYTYDIDLLNDVIFNISLHVCHLIKDNNFEFYYRFIRGKLIHTAAWIEIHVQRCFLTAFLYHIIRFSLSYTDVKLSIDTLFWKRNMINIW